MSAIHKGPRRLLPAVEAPLSHLAVSPAVRADEGPPPGLLLLHGRGADERDLLGLAPALDPRLLIVSARAPLPLGWGYHWYELGEIGAPESESFGRSLDLLAAFIPTVVTGFGIDPRRLFLLGFSQGAMMSGSIALTRPDLAAGAVLLSGYLPLSSGLPIAEDRLAGFPVFVGHGVDDPVIPVAFGRQAGDYLTRIGANLTYREYPIEHRISELELDDIAAWLSSRLAASS